MSLPLTITFGAADVYYATQASWLPSGWAGWQIVGGGLPNSLLAVAWIDYGAEKVLVNPARTPQEFDAPNTEQCGPNVRSRPGEACMYRFRSPGALQVGIAHAVGATWFVTDSILSFALYKKRPREVAVLSFPGHAAVAGRW